MTGIFILACLALLIPPPSHLPDLHAVLICTYSFVHFVVFFVVFYWLQWTAIDDDAHSSTVTFADTRKLKTH